MPSTYTTNLGIEKPAIGEQAGSWGTTVNTNMDIIDASINGIISITLAATGSSGSPNTLDISDGAVDDGHNKWITFTDGGDLGGDAYVQLTPNDAEKVCWITNSLSGSRDIYLFQGTYDAARDYLLTNGQSALIAFDGQGAGSSTATAVSGSIANGVDALTAAEVTQLANIDSTTISAADWVALSNLSGTNSGDQTITLTGDVTGSGTGSFAATIANDAVETAMIADNQVTLAKLDDGMQGDILYYGAAGAPARLGAGTNGYYLKTQGAGANPVWAEVSSPAGSNSFTTHTVDDTDVGYTWAGTGSAVATSATDTLTWVSGTNIDIDVDAASDAIRITANNSITGYTGNKAGFDAACTDGNFVYNGDDITELSGTKSNFNSACTDGTFAYDGGAHHDGFSDFVANEHIDWTSTSSNFSTSGTVATGALTVTGAITATGDITAFYTSDIALKQHIEPITGALDKVMKLTGSRFEYKKEKEGKFYGLMAQEVQKVMPELVQENADGDLTIRMAGFELVALLVEAVKELKDKLDDYTN
jgi:hypothetical protein